VGKRQRGEKLALVWITMEAWRCATNPPGLMEKPG
jgi:hypothetical protein